MAENEELQALLEVLQQLTDHGRSLTALSDERPLRGADRATSRAVDVPARSPDLLAAEPQPDRSAFGRGRRRH
jgi:hypothetical protein